MHLTIEVDVPKKVGEEWQTFLEQEEEARVLITQSIVQIIEQRRKQKSTIREEDIDWSTMSLRSAFNEDEEDLYSGKDIKHERQLEALVEI